MTLAQALAFAEGGGKRDSGAELSRQDKNVQRQRLERASSAKQQEEKGIGMMQAQPPLAPSQHQQQQLLQAKAAECLSVEELKAVLRVQAGNNASLDASLPQSQGSLKSSPPGSSSNLCSLPSSSHSYYHAKPISFSKASCPPPGSPIGGSPPEAPFFLTCKTAQLKHAPQHSSLSVSCPHSSVIGPGSFKEKEQGNEERKNSMGRSISAMFKGAFKSSLFSPSSSSVNLNHISGPAAIPNPPSASMTSAGSPSHKQKPLSLKTQPAADASSAAGSPLQPCSPNKGSSPAHKGMPKSSSSFSFKAMLNSLQSPSFSQPQSPAAPALADAQAPAPPPPPPPPATKPPCLDTPCKDVVSNSSAAPDKTQDGGTKSLDLSATREAEAKAAALRRAISVSGRIAAPPMLLVVTKDLPPRMSRPSWSLKDYVVLEKMYTGYASNVYQARCKHSGVLVCLKSYTLGNLCELNRFQIFREVKLHSSLSHEHVIKLYGAFQQADQVVLVQEFASMGDLFNLLHRYGGRLPERTAVELVLQPFLSVLNYLHVNGIAHRDIKPENILYTSDMRLKLADFGLAINMREERAVTRAGTLEYMAPEVLDCPFKNKPEENKGNRMLHYSYHVDTWAVGVLTYELLVGLPPFNDKQRNAVEDKIRLAPPRFPSKMSEECRDFITMALEKNPLERPTVMELLTHPWIRVHKRSSSIQHLSTLEKRGTAGINHSASQILNVPIMEGPECSEGVQQAPPQKPVQGGNAAMKAADATQQLESAHSSSSLQQQKQWHVGNTDKSPSNKPHASAIAPVADTLSPLPRPPTCFLSFSNKSKASLPLDMSSQPLPSLSHSQGPHSGHSGPASAHQ